MWVVRQGRWQEAESLAGVVDVGLADVGVSAIDEEASAGLGSFFQSCAKLVPSEWDLRLRLGTGKVLKQRGCELLPSILGLALVAGLAGPLPSILALDNLVLMMPGCLCYRALIKLPRFLQPRPCALSLQAFCYPKFRKK